jgi:glycosyltransferase involved in cell wall biosynthesis
MTNGLPLVTVIAVCYNHERFIMECLEGIRTQSYKNIQLIVMDDYSLDNSVEMVNKWIRETQYTCQFIHHEQNMGLCKTLNQALNHVKGKYVAILSTDDVWLPEFIEDRVRVIETGGDEVGMVYGKSFRIDEDGNLLPGLIQSCPKTPTGHIFEELIEENFVAANTVLIRKSCYDTIGLYDEELFAEDYDMWIRIGKMYRFSYSRNVLSKYRILPTSLAHANPEKISMNRVKVLLKTLKSSPEHKDIILKRLVTLRNVVYRLDYPIAQVLYRRALQERFSKKDLLMWILAQTGFSYVSSVKISKWLQRILVTDNQEAM